MNMKKLAVIVMCALVITSVCGCGVSRESDGEKSVTTLTVMKPKSMKGFDDIANRYEQSHGDVQIRIIDMPDITNEIYKIYMASLSGRDSDIDIMLISDIWTAEFAESGYIEPLTFFTDKDKYEPDAVDFFSYGGKMYAQPFALDIGALFYRKDRVEKPNGYEDIIKNAGDGTPVFEKKKDEDLLCTAIELGENLKAAYPLFGECDTENSGDLKTKFKNGEINYYRGWSKDYTYFNDYDFEIGGNVGAVIPKTPVLGGYGLAVSSFSQNKEKAFSFISYFADSANVREVLKREGYIPVFKEFLDDEMFADYNPCMYKINDSIARSAVRNSDASYVKKAWELQENIYTAICENKEALRLEEIYKLKSMKGRGK